MEFAAHVSSGEVEHRRKENRTCCCRSVNGVVLRYDHTLRKCDLHHNFTGHRTDCVKRGDIGKRYSYSVLNNQQTATTQANLSPAFGNDGRCS